MGQEDPGDGKEVLLADGKHVVPILVGVESAGALDGFLEAELVEHDHDVGILGDGFVSRTHEHIAQRARRQIRALRQEQDVIESRPRDSAAAAVPYAGGGAEEGDLRRVVRAGDEPAAAALDFQIEILDQHPRPVRGL